VRLARGASRVLLAASVLAMTGCAGSAPSPAASSTETVTVFAAASLSATFTELADRFETEHPGVTVALTVAGSADLISQVAEGAPVDVIATADTTTMATLADEGLLAGDAVIFAGNTLEIAVPPDNPAGITSFADLAAPGLNLVVCAPQVPCGAATTAVADAAGVELAPVSEENSVTDVLGKVRSGEADAGLVYVTDVAGAAGEVLGIEFEESAAAVNEYPIAVLGASAHGELAGEFSRFVTGDAGRAVLAGAGFDAP
jgi:molybdate transport system substrate-binding protein